MNASLRMIVVAVVVGLLALGVFGLRLACSPSDLQEEYRRGEELRRLRRITDRRMEARQQAMQEWIAQRRTLAETMQRFQELDHEWPDYVTQQRNGLPSDEERHYRILTIYAKDTLQGRPEELAAVLRRLEKDYQKWRAGSVSDRSTPKNSGR